MSLLPLTLGVGLGSDVEGGGVKPLSKSKSESVLRRDDFTCRFCGFRAVQFQRIVPYEGDVVTACTFCEQVTSLERAGMMGCGVLIWLPEITQAELNHIARAIYVARADETGDTAEAATRALDSLMTRRAEAKKRLGSDDPMLLATILIENLTEAERKAAITKLDGIRLMPLDKHMVRGKHGDANGFPQIVKFWRSESGPFADLPTSEWSALFAKLAA